MKKQITLLLCSLLLWLGTTASPNGRLAHAQTITDPKLAVQQAVRWLVNTHQNDDGGYSSFSVAANNAPSDVSGTLDAILAISSAGYNANMPAPGKTTSPVAYLASQPEALATFAAIDGASAGKLVLALTAVNQNPHTFADQDWVEVLQSHLSEDGTLAANPFGQALAILGLAAAGADVPPTALDKLIASQAEDGSWDDGFGTASNADSTAMAIMALVATGSTTNDGPLGLGLTFIQESALESGGWEYGPGFGFSANSTALVLQALAAVGHAQDNPAALAALLAGQNNVGAFQADFGNGPVEDFFTTVQVIPALTGKTLPLPNRWHASQQALSCLRSLQDPATGGWEQFATNGPNAAGTSRAIQAIVAAGEDPRTWVAGEIDAVTALASLTPPYLETSDGGGVGIILQGVIAAGADGRSFAGTDLVAQIQANLSPDGTYANTDFGPFGDAEAILGLVAAGEKVDETAVAWLMAAQTDGDWGGADSNGLVLQLLQPLSQTVPAQTLNILHSTQLPDGGWGFDTSSVNSTAEVAQGLAAIGLNPFDPSWGVVTDGRFVTPLDFVLSQQGANGCWPNLYGPGDDPFATTDALLLLNLNPAWPITTDAQAVQGVESPATVAPIATESPAATATVTSAPTQTATAVPTVESTATVAAVVTDTAVGTDTAAPKETISPTDTVSATAVPVATQAIVATTEQEQTGTVLPWVLLAVMFVLIGGTAYWASQSRR